MRSWWRYLQAALALFGATAAHADPLAESLGEGIVRYWADAATRDGAPVSVMLAEPRAGTALAAPTGVVPRFLDANGGRIVRLDVPRGATLHGTGEVGGPLVRNGRTINGGNTDADGESAPRPSRYH
jgi:alpha-glucosidase